jgi:N-acylneuraminate cytidylyltransferase
MKTLFVITARGGSKGIPGKNIKPLGGKPLLHYSIEQARAWAADDDICLSTDDVQIAECAMQAGLNVPFTRPAALSTDTAGSYEVLLHALSHYEQTGRNYDALVLLQPTSPFRTARQIGEALQLFTTEIDMVVSVTNSKANPYYNLFEEDANGFLHRSKPGNYVRRQDAPPVYEYNGAIYVINTASLKDRSIAAFERVRKYEMDAVSSLDLDTPLDWQFAEFLLDRKIVSC